MEQLKVGSEFMEEEHEAHCSPPNERKRKSLDADDNQLSADPEEVGERSKDVAVNLSKKKRNEEAEAMDAETQRLLRESKKVAFPEGQLQQKSISSVLEKMRQRKLQRAQKIRSTQQSVNVRPILGVKQVPGDSASDVDLDSDIELVMGKPPTQRVLAVKQEPCEPSATGKVRSLQNIAALVESVGGTGRPSTQETRSEACHPHKPSVVSSKRENLARPNLIESQDLYSDSQLSPVRDDEFTPLPQLYSDTQTEDSSSPEEDEEKENKDPIRAVAPLPTVSLVRGLVDDEAEDEDEDLLEDEENEDEDEDTAEDLRDLLTQDVTEKPADGKRRADLHRKWLEQQDMSLTDSILNGIGNRWNNRAKKLRLPGILDEANDNDSKRSKTEYKESQISHEVVEEPAEPVSDNSPTSLETTTEMGKDQVKRERSSEVEEVMEGANSQEFEDGEEDEWFRRQRMLNESEEQSELPSVHDDVTSREIFNLINKVNIATIKTTKVTTGINDIRPLGMVHDHTLSHVQSSFARRIVTTSVQATTRQGSGNSRSYIFGRDDSNSNRNSRLQCGKELPPATATAAGDNQNSNSRINPTPRSGATGAKGNSAKAVEATGPSLFQILKQQAADLERSVLTRDSSFSLNRNSSRSGDLSIFSVMRPSKPSRKSRG